MDIPATITIGGVDRTAFIDARSVRHSNSLNHAVDTLDFTVIDHDGTLSGAGFSPVEEEIVVLDDEGNKLFGGNVKTSDENTQFLSGDYRSTWRCQALDYTDVLTRKRVTRVWIIKTDEEIIQEAFAEYLPGFDAETFVQGSGQTHIRFWSRRETMLDIMNRLSAASGFSWYIDAEKNLHYFPDIEGSAPFGISDTPDNVVTFNAIDLTYAKDSTDLANVITVVGGTKASENTTFTFAGDGVNKNFLLFYRMSAPTGENSIIVEINEGDDDTPVWGDPLDVGIDNISDPESVDVLYNFQEKILRFTDAPPALIEAWRITGRYPVPILIRKRSFLSFERYGDWFEDKYLDRKVNDDETAIRIASSLLAERAFEKETVRFRTYERGLRAGQTIQVTDSTKGIDGQYLIHNVSARFDGADNIEYSIECGQWNPDLSALLRDVRYRLFSEEEVDEIVTELLGISENLTFAEAWVIAQALVLKWGETNWGSSTWA